MKREIKIKNKKTHQNSCMYKQFVYICMSYE